MNDNGLYFMIDGEDGWQIPERHFLAEIFGFKMLYNFRCIAQSKPKNSNGVDHVKDLFYWGVQNYVDGAQKDTKTLLGIQNIPIDSPLDAWYANPARKFVDVIQLLFVPNNAYTTKCNICKNSYCLIKDYRIYQFPKAIFFLTRGMCRVKDAKI